MSANDIYPYGSFACSTGMGFWDLTPSPPQEARDWTCVYCGAVQPPKTYTCSRCAAPREEGT